jgi:hypothetical protein
MAADRQETRSAATALRRLVRDIDRASFQIRFLLALIALTFLVVIPLLVVSHV